MNTKSTPKNSIQKSGFTLVELLVVIAVIGILISLLIPAVQMVREAARRTHCTNNMRQVGLGLHMYHDTHRQFPAGWDGDYPVGEPGWGWASRILPYLEKVNMQDNINYAIPIDDDYHQNVREAPIKVYLCPSDHNPYVMELGFIDDGHVHMNAGPQAVFQGHEHGENIKVSRCNYSGVFGSNDLENNPSRGNGTFYFRSRVGFKSFRDGTSNTIVVGERKSELGTVTWVGVVPGVAHPMARIVGVADHAPNNSGAQHFEDFSSHHPSGANFVSGDCSVRMIHNQVDTTIFRGLSTVAGGEIVFYEDN